MIYQFVAAADPISDIIEFYERGLFSHVDCVLADNTLLGARSDRVGGKMPGVQIRPPDYAKWSRKVQIKLPATAEQETAWLNFLMAQVGKPYDTIDLLADFAAGRDWRNPDAWWCSELGMSAAESSMFLPKSIGQGVNYITPRDLFIVLSPWAL